MLNEEVKKLWGFHPMFESYYLFELETNPHLYPARIVFAGQDHYKVLLLGQEKEFLAKVRGLYHHEGWALPVVGDWVLIEMLEGEQEYLRIYQNLPRRTALQRFEGAKGAEVLLANIDSIGLVTSFNEDLNIRRLERGLLMVRESGAEAFIVINKSDLVSFNEIEKVKQELTERLGAVKIFICSAKKDEGLQELQEYFSLGQTTAFLGMSGVGKSSLTNRIVGEEVLEIQNIREDDSRGRHTTTHRELFLTKQKFWLADTPGIRSFAAAADENSLNEIFNEISELAEQCKFSDCQHQDEPDCAVMEALASGELSEDRWQNYLKMRKELHFQERKRNKALMSETKKMWAKRAQEIRQKNKK